MQGQNLNFAVPVAALRRMDWEPKAGGISLVDRANKIITSDFRAARRVVIEAEARGDARLRDPGAFADGDPRAEVAQVDEAAARLERVSKFAANDADVWEYLGRARACAAFKPAPFKPTIEELRDRAPLVIQAFERAVALDPNRYRAWEELSTWYLTAGRRVDYDRAVSEIGVAKVRWLEQIVKESRESK